MARVNVWMPDDLAERARAADLNVSALAQAAVAAELDARATDVWLATLPQQQPPRVSHEDIIAALDEARAEMSREE